MCNYAYSNEKVQNVLRMSRALLPTLIASGDGHIVNIGSIAGFETYPGGAGYTAAKHALRALTMASPTADQVDVKLRDLASYTLELKDIMRDFMLAFARVRKRQNDQ